MSKRLAPLLLLALSTAAAELTGTWTGTFSPLAPDGSVANSGPAHLVLKQDGQTVTGSAGPSAGDQHEIRNGKLDGKRLTFEISPSDGATIKFDLVFDGDSIKGEAAGTRDGQPMRARLDVKRQP